MIVIGATPGVPGPQVAAATLTIRGRLDGLADTHPGLATLLDAVGPRIELVAGDELCCGAHGDTEDTASPPVITLPVGLPLERAPPSPGKRRVEATPSLPGVLDHEIGHAVEQAFVLAAGLDLPELYRQQHRSKMVRGVSRYVAHDEHEWFAESLAAFLHPECAAFNLDPTLTDRLNAVLIGDVGGMVRNDAQVSQRLCGAGVLLVYRGDQGDRVLFVRDAQDGLWELPGGKIEDGEGAEDAARREVTEETGLTPDGPISLMLRDSLTGVDYSTFIAHVTELVEPTLSDEHTEWQWAAPTSPPQPLHPGVQLALDRLKMNELDIARAIAAGKLPSPQQYENIWLFALRITGTGVSYRQELDEYVWREPRLYLNDDFLARCNGLPVIYEHPPTEELTQTEWEKRIIGSITLPYLIEDEVWGIARVYDQDAARLMRHTQMSTSPAVIFRDPSVNRIKKLDGGKHLLIEGEPSLLDHVAVCELGVWDKSGEPTGISIGSEPETAPDMLMRADAALPPSLPPPERFVGLGGVVDQINRVVERIERMAL